MPPCFPLSRGLPSRAPRLCRVRSSPARSLFGLSDAPTALSHRERRLLAYPPSHVYAVVSSVEHYSHFVPWCLDSRVLQRAPDGRYLEAELAVGFRLFSESYTSRVTMVPRRSVRVRGGGGA